MMLFKIVAYLAFAMLLAGQAIVPAAAEVVASAVGSAAVTVTGGNFTEGNLSDGTIQIQAKDFAPLKVVDLLSTPSGEDDACTHIVSLDTMSTTVAPPDNSSILIAASAPTTSSAALFDTHSQTEVVSLHNVSVSASGLLSALSEDGVAQTPNSTGAVSTTTPPDIHTSVSVTLIAASFTLTWTSISHSDTASSSVGGNLTTLALSTPSNTSFTVTFTRNPPVGTGNPSSATTINPQPTLPTLAAPSTGTGTAAKKSGGTKASKDLLWIPMTIMAVAGVFLF